jgi:hypothetical protein
MLGTCSPARNVVPRNPTKRIASMRLPILAILALSAAIPLPAQSQPKMQGQAQKKSSAQPVYEGPLELPCARVLAMPSSDFIAQIVAIDDYNVDGQLRGIRRYGYCYSSQTDALAASLAKSGKGPGKAARADFAAFETALKDFTAKALADAPPQPWRPMEAYAELYEKQFRYAFYQSYSQKPAQHSSAEANKSVAPDANAPPTGAPSPAKPETDPLTLAKNRFGQLLAALPEEKRREIHRAFGEIFEKGPIGEQWKLEVYRYAIFILEPPKDTPFSPPPF